MAGRLPAHRADRLPRTDPYLSPDRIKLATPFALAMLSKSVNVVSAGRHTSEEIAGIVDGHDKAANDLLPR
jgi:hypothetical protein